MTCEQYGPLLSLYLDGMLEPRQREDVRAHTRDCPACAARLAAYRQMETRIVGALRVTPSPRFNQAVMAATGARQLAAAEAHPEGTRRRAARRRAQLLLGGLTGASSAALIALVLGVASNLSPLRSAHPGPAGRHPYPIVSTTAGSPGWYTKVNKVAGKPSASPDTEHAIATIGVPLVAATMTGIVSPTPNLPRLHEATGMVDATPVDRAAALRIAATTSLPDADAEYPLWSGNSHALLYLIDQQTDPRTGWQAGTLVRYDETGSSAIHRQVMDYAWSPDSRGIVYTAQAPDAGAASDLAEQLHIVGANGSGDRVLTRVDRASVEYLSDHITAVQRGRLMAIDPATGAGTPLANMPSLGIADESSAFWALSAGERFFAYQDGAGLRVWDRRRGGRLVLHASLAKLGQASFHFSWDGRLIFYSTFDGRYTMLYRESLDPLGEPQALNDGKPLHGPILQVGSPSPNSALLNFRTGQRNMTISYVIDTRHGRAHRLLPPNGAGVGPVGTWSPDGTRLVYTIYRNYQAVESGIARVTR